MCGRAPAAMMPASEEDESKEGSMIVSVQHRIKDPQAFFAKGPELTGKLPEGVRPLQFYPSTDATVAACLWEGTTLARVQDHIDTVLGDTAEQEYFAVDTENALGLPA